MATQSVNILHYSLIHCQFLRASDAKLAKVASKMPSRFAAVTNKEFPFEDISSQELKKMRSKSFICRQEKATTAAVRSLCAKSVIVVLNYRTVLVNTHTIIQLSVGS